MHTTVAYNFFMYEFYVCLSCGIQTMVTMWVYSTVGETGALWDTGLGGTLWFFVCSYCFKKINFYPNMGKRLRHIDKKNY